MGKLLWRKSPSEKVIYLTFDDGPVPEVTPTVLNILDRYNVKATFFCVGENVQKYPAIYSELLHRGHKTGNHTHTHLKGFNTSAANYIDNVKIAAKLIDSKLFRPPHGQLTLKQIRLLKQDYEIVMWDLITHDYNTNLTVDAIVRNIKRHCRNGSIIVFHDSIKAKENMLTALPLAIKYLINQGYSFGVL